jgi:hypothetical protein
LFFFPFNHNNFSFAAHLFVFHVLFDFLLVFECFFVVVASSLSVSLAVWLCIFALSLSVSVSLLLSISNAAFSWVDAISLMLLVSGLD